MSETCSHCGKSVIAGSYRTCPECLEYLDGEAKPKRVPDGRIASVCPNCGKAAHHKVKPTRLVAFAYDRVCDECSTRYVPPTPAWAAIVFIVLGLLLAGIEGFEVLLHLRDAEYIAIPFKLLFVVMGVVSLGFGIRSLRTGLPVKSS